MPSIDDFEEYELLKSMIYFLSGKPFNASVLKELSDLRYRVFKIATKAEVDNVVE